MTNSWDDLQYAVVCGYRIAYRRGGQGETVVLVHGVTTASFIWRRIFPLLTPHYDVIAVDLLGCGDSDKPPGGDYSVRNQAGLLAELLRQLEVAPVHLVGHDVGGAIGQVMAVGHADLLRDAALLNTVGYDYWPVQPIITLRTPIIRQLAMATLDHGVLRIIVRRGLYHRERANDELLAHFHRQVSADDARKPFLHFLRCLNNRDLMDIAPELRRLSVPILIVRGKADVYLSGDISRRLRDDIPGSTLVELETAGHFVQEDEPELLTAALMKHFAGRSNG